MKNKKTISKTILNKINLINELMPIIKTLDMPPLTYDNGTFPFYIELNDIIKTKNQFVYINSVDSKYNHNFNKRYNVNQFWILDELKYDLNLILKTFKKELNK
jgi:hypothetical protein